MAGKISIECPACSAKLNVSDPSKLGKKIKCPKCQEVFAPELPSDDDGDLMDDFGDDDAVERRPKLAPIQRGRGGAKSGKGGAKGSSRESSDGGSNGMLIGVGVAAAVVLLGGIGLIASGVFSNNAPPLDPNAAASSPAPAAAATTSSPAAPVASTIPAGTSPAAGALSKPAGTSGSAPMSDSEKTLALRWLPANTDLYFHIKPSQILKSPMIPKIVEAAGQPVDSVNQQNFKQINATDIESISWGMAGFVDLIVETANRKRSTQTVPGTPPSAGMANDLQSFIMTAQKSYVLVIRTSKDLDLDQYRSQTFNGNPIKSEGAKKYLMVEYDMGVPQGMWLPDPRTLIMATEKELMASMRNGESAQVRPEFSSMDPTAQFLVALFMRELTKDELSQLTSSAANPGGMPSPFATINRSAIPKSTIFGLSIKGGIDLKLSEQFASTEGSAEFKNSLENGREQLKAMYTLFKDKMPKPIAETVDLLLASWKIEEQNQTVKLSLGVPESAQATLALVPAAVAELFSKNSGLAATFLPGMGGDPSVAGSADDVFRQPGETDAVAPASSEGLPDGLAMVGRSAWSSTASTLSDGTSAITMEVVVDVTGDSLDKVCAATGISGKTMKLDTGTKLKLSKLSAPGGIDLLKTPLPFDVTDETDKTHPANTLRVRMVVDAPSQTATKIDVVEGSFKIYTAKESQEHTIEEVVKRAKRPLNQPEFKTAELKLRRSHSDVSPQTLTLWCGKDYLLGKVKGSPDDIVSFTELEKEQVLQRLYATDDSGKLPEDFQISFKLYSKIEEHSVSFRFENIPLPDKNAKPMLQSQSE